MVGTLGCSTNVVTIAALAFEHEVAGSLGVAYLTAPSRGGDWGLGHGQQLTHGLSYDAGSWEQSEKGHWIAALSRRRIRCRRLAATLWVPGQSGAAECRLMHLLRMPLKEMLSALATEPEQTRACRTWFHLLRRLGQNARSAPWEPLGIAMGVIAIVGSPGFASTARWRQMQFYPTRRPPFGIQRGAEHGRSSVG